VTRMQPGARIFVVLALVVTAIDASRTASAAPPGFVAGSRDYGGLVAGPDGNRWATTWVSVEGIQTW
jgi:hypothetical protein